MATQDFGLPGGINSYAVSEYGDDAAFPPAYDSSETGLIVKNSLSSGIYRYEVGLLSILIEVDADATFNTLKFRFLLDSKTSTDGLSLLIAFYAYDGIAKADHYTTSPTSGAASVALSALTVGIVNEISLSNFLAYVPHNGRLGIRLALTATSPGGVNAIALSSPVFRLDYSRPNAPDQLAIDGDASNGTGIIRTDPHDFTWVPFEGNGLSQIKYEVQWRTVGTPTWGANTTGVITSSLPLKTFAGSSFSNGNYEWRVQVTFSDNSVSPWSEIKTFTVGDAVTAPTLTAPTGTVTTGLPTATWTSGVAGRDDWQLQILQGSSIVYDTGAQPGTATSHALVATYFQTALKRLADHTSYIPRVRIRDGGIWSAWTTGSFSVALTRPASPTITVTPVHASGYNLITITPGSGGDTVESYTILRSEGEKETYDEITSDLTELTYKDRTAKHDVESTYRVQAIGVSGGYDYSLPASATLVFTLSAWLHSLDDPDSAVGFNLYRGKRPRARNRTRAYPFFVGRTRPVTRRGPHKREEIAVTLAALHEEDKLDGLLDILDSDETLCLRTNYRDRFFGDSQSDSVDPEVGTVDAGLSALSFPFIVTDYQEGPIDVELPSTRLVSLVSHWKLDETSSTRNDSHGTNHLTDNNTVTSGTGKIDKAAQFVRANSEYLSIADNATLSAGDFDFMFYTWVKITTFAGAGNEPFIISKVGGGPATTWEYRLSHRINQNRLTWTVGDGSGIIQVDASSFGAPSLNAWYLVYCGFDSANNQIFIQVNNGTINTASFTGVPLNGASAFALGGRDDSGFDGVDGLIDETGFVRGRLWSAAERTDHYNGGAGSAYPFS